MSKVARPRPAARTKGKDGWPLVVYVWMAGLGFLGYVVIRMGLDAYPHPIHWLGDSAVPCSAAGSAGCGTTAAATSCKRRRALLPMGLTANLSDQVAHLAQRGTGRVRALEHALRQPGQHRQYSAHFSRHMTPPERRHARYTGGHAGPHRHLRKYLSDTPCPL